MFGVSYERVKYYWKTVYETLYLAHFWAQLHGFLCGIEFHSIVQSCQLKQGISSTKISGSVHIWQAWHSLMAKAARFATSPRQSQASELILSKVIADHVDYARLISASVELKSVRNQIRKHLGNFFGLLVPIPVQLCQLKGSNRN